MSEFMGLITGVTSWVEDLGPPSNAAATSTVEVFGATE